MERRISAAMEVIAEKTGCDGAERLSIGLWVFREGKKKPKLKRWLGKLQPVWSQAPYLTTPTANPVGKRIS